MDVMERRAPHRKKRGWGRLGAAGLVGGVIAALALPLSASAAPTIPDPDALGSISVHKFETPDSGSTVGTGAAVDTTGWTPIPGVEFRVRQVNTIDLTTETGWQDASALAKAFQAANGDLTTITTEGYTLGTAVTPDQAATDSTGLQVFSNLPIGLYLVEEISAPTSIDPDGAGPLPAEPVSVTPAAPFLVTVPLTLDSDPDANPPQLRDTWVYDVNVYPKNAITKAQKSVVDAPVVQAGDDTNWTISADIKGRPADLDGDGTVGPDYTELYAFQGYTIVDDLDDELQFLTETTPVDRTLTVTLKGGAVGSDEVLVAGDDYTLTGPDADNVLTIDLTADGLTKLSSHHGGTIEVSFWTRALASKEYVNSAIVYPNGSEVSEDFPPVTTNEVESKYGGIRIWKTDDSATPVNLQGAVFEVYTGLLPDGSPDPATKVVVDLDGDGDPATPAPDGAQSQWTTDANGDVTIEGLRYSDFVNGRDIDSDDDGEADDPADQALYNTYYLVEVKAPTGSDGKAYSLLPQPLEFYVFDQPSAAGGAQADQHVVNVPHNAGFSLPLTGGTGTALLITVGAVLLGGGLLLLILFTARRRRAQGTRIPARL